MGDCVLCYGALEIVGLLLWLNQRVCVYAQNVKAQMTLDCTYTHFFK